MSTIQIETVVQETFKVDGKTFTSREEAEAALARLASLQEGLAFANAQYPDLAEKAKRGKANVIAEYIDWVAAGKPAVEQTSVGGAE